MIVLSKEKNFENLFRDYKDMKRKYEEKKKEYDIVYKAWETEVALNGDCTELAESLGKTLDNVTDEKDEIESDYDMIAHLTLKSLIEIKE